jgi:hypothetical protein
MKLLQFTLFTQMDTYMPIMQENKKMGIQRFTNSSLRFTDNF